MIVKTKYKLGKFVQVYHLLILFIGLRTKNFFIFTILRPKNISIYSILKMGKHCKCNCNEIKCKRSKPLIFQAILNGINEVPPNSSVAVGSFIAILTGCKKLTFILQTTGLAGTITGATLNIASVGQVGPLAVNLSINPATGLATGTLEIGHCNALSKNFICQLLQGLVYVNITTVGFPTGEIRGQILPINNQCC